MKTETEKPYIEFFALGWVRLGDVRIRLSSIIGYESAGNAVFISASGAESRMFYPWPAEGECCQTSVRKLIEVLDSHMAELATREEEAWTQAGKVDEQIQWKLMKGLPGLRYLVNASHANHVITNAQWSEWHEWIDAVGYHQPKTQNSKPAAAVAQ